MTSFFPDLNVWFALSVEGHAHGGAAWQWLQRLPTGPKIVFCTHTFLGLIRLLTNSAAMGKRIMTVSQALEVYDAWLGDPRVVFFPEPRDLSAGFREAIAPLGKLPATNAVSDCYLAAFSKEVGSTLVTIDRALFSAVRKRGGKAICLV
jgi:toxin-antitoxin system PIN domain toxin